LQSGDEDDDRAKRQLSLITTMRRVLKDYRAYNKVIYIYPLCYLLT